MSAPSAARYVRSVSLRVGVWASAVAFGLIEGYTLSDQWLIGHASALFIIGTALLIAGVCTALFSIIDLIGFAVSLFFDESAPNQARNPSGRVGPIGNRSNPRTNTRIKPNAIRAPSSVAKRKRHLSGLGS
jgi:hypothetical protein